VLDRPLAEAESEQLSGRNSAGLPLGEHRNGRIARLGEKALTVKGFSPHPPNRAARGSRRGRNRHFRHSSMTKLT
jgi:hypothetical protein